MDIQAIVTEWQTAARAASKDCADKYYDGKDGGACGFAWVSIYPEHKGNTKAGKAERALLKELGFRPSYDRDFQRFNPGDWMGQSIDIKEAGAVAAANVLKKHGFRAYAGSRLD